ncbi:MAG TPA: hypothetical protein VHF25_09480, partial [Nitriliruptorales bacterium]|nr:hypothetical protein [Nitriliruptorales bacterium]
MADVRADAVHGSFCPKMCSFRCPVVAATGDERAVPWALHTVVAALATGARPPDGRAYRALRGCTGCHACRDACLYDLDVPAQVQAGRAAVVAAGEAPPAVAVAVAHVAAGRSPY